MKGMKAATAMRAVRRDRMQVCYEQVAANMGMRPEDVRTAIEVYWDWVSLMVTKNGSFNVAGMLKLRHKTVKAAPARKGVNPNTKQPCIFAARPVSFTVSASPLKKLKDMVN